MDTYHKHLYYTNNLFQLHVDVWRIKMAYPIWIWKHSKYNGYISAATGWEGKRESVRRGHAEAEHS